MNTANHQVNKQMITTFVIGKKGFIIQKECCVLTNLLSRKKVSGLVAENP